MPSKITVAVAKEKVNEKNKRAMERYLLATKRFEGKTARILNPLPAPLDRPVLYFRSEGRGKQWLYARRRNLPDSGVTAQPDATRPQESGRCQGVTLKVPLPAAVGHPQARKYADFPTDSKY